MESSSCPAAGMALPLALSKATWFSKQSSTGITIPHHSLAGAHGETNRVSAPDNCIPKPEWHMGQNPVVHFLWGKCSVIPNR